MVFLAIAVPRKPVEKFVILLVTLKQAEDMEEFSYIVLSILIAQVSNKKFANIASTLPINLSRVQTKFQI